MINRIAIQGTQNGKVILLNPSTQNIAGKPDTSKAFTVSILFILSWILEKFYTNIKSVLKLFRSKAAMKVKSIKQKYKRTFLVIFKI